MAQVASIWPKLIDKWRKQRPLISIQCLVLQWWDGSQKFRSYLTANLSASYMEPHKSTISQWTLWPTYIYYIAMSLPCRPTKIPECGRRSQQSSALWPLWRSPPRLAPSARELWIFSRSWTRLAMREPKDSIHNFVDLFKQEAFVA